MNGFASGKKIAAIGLNSHQTLQRKMAINNCFIPRFIQIVNIWSFFLAFFALILSTPPLPYILPLPPMPPCIGWK